MQSCFCRFSRQAALATKQTWKKFCFRSSPLLCLFVLPRQIYRAFLAFPCCENFSLELFACSHQTFLRRVKMCCLLLFLSLWPILFEMTEKISNFGHKKNIYENEKMIEAFKLFRTSDQNALSKKNPGYLHKRAVPLHKRAVPRNHWGR